MEKGILLVFSGPSGVGKGTIVKQILKIKNDFSLSISSTTRGKREGETDGKDYFFITKKEFQTGIKNNEFVEHAEFAGNYYGTKYSTINNSINNGQNLILEIDVQGAMQIKSKFPDANLIFILPPNVEELKKRLIGRNTESKEAIELRLAQVDRELLYSNAFDKKIINDDLQIAIKEVCDYIDSLK